MRIKYARVSAGLRFFERHFLENYNLKRSSKLIHPCVMFGMYRTEDFLFYAKHKAPIIVVWCGSDSITSRMTPMRKKILLSKPHRHIATHDFGSADLTKMGIPHKVVPLTPAKIDYDLQPRGDNVYFYSAGSDDYKDRIYGRKHLPEIKSLIKGIKIIEADQNTYNRDQLKQVYKSCFIALRLTKHDGVPTTVLEMGIMGRKSIFNGSVPHCIHWNSPGDIAENILSEYQTRKEDNIKIANDIRNYINVGTEWLIV